MTGIRPVFLLSLPRSGSTLLQRLIAAHPDVATAAEPWLLLAPLYALRPDGVFAEYGHATAATALQDLCDRLPEGEDGYLHAVASMAGEVYRALSPPGTTVFLDKTPRYCLVVHDLLRAFPDAPVIALHRNPLAVVASISETWLEGRWQPHLHKIDLYSGLERLVAAQQQHPDRILGVRYEDLIAQPETELKRVMDHLDVPWHPAVLDGAARVRPAGRMGDATGTAAYTAISAEPLDKWRTSLSSPLRRQWCRRYLRWIGAERLRLMGYELDGLLADLSHTPPRWRQVPADGAHAVKGVARDLLEPDLLRAKAAAFPRWHRIGWHA